VIHYHGVPISGTKKESVPFLTNRHALVSFAEPGWLDIVAESCASFALDNGAFSAWKRGLVMDFPGYADWVEEWKRHPGFDWAIIPDVIEGDEDDNDKLIQQWPHEPALSVPVWHFHESLTRLESLCQSFPRVALGSSGKWPSPGRHSWWERMAEAMAAACYENGRPMAKLHGLRMLDPAIFCHLPLSSADSTSVAVNAGSLSRFGYVAPSAGVRAEVIAGRIEQWNSASVWLEKDRLFEVPR
jgi:hypothetical protein